MSNGTRISFEKWEGLGNDFVLVEEDAAAWADERVRAVCDRRRGVGADGVLFVSRGAAGELPRMVVRNADGSRPEMCGNGIRCVAGFLAARAARGGERRGKGLRIETDAGVKRCEVSGGDGVFEVAVAMGAARVEGTLVVEVGGRPHVFTRVDVGNPHAITFEPYEESAVDVVGPRVATSPAGGTNVEFCRVVRGDGASGDAASGDAASGDAASGEGETPRVDVVVWERGVGRTLACGTGACAVAAAACAAGYFEYGVTTRVRLPGGDLRIVVEAGSGEATMTGPARRVFSGELVVAGEPEPGTP